MRIGNSSDSSSVVKQCIANLIVNVKLYFEEEIWVLLEQSIIFGGHMLTGSHLPYHL